MEVLMTRADMNAIEVMEQIETIVMSWQKGDIDSEEALEQITTLVDKL